MKLKQWGVLEDFEAFFAQPDLIWLDINRSVIDLATAIRVHHGLKTPDAIQAACCLQLGKNHLFVTGDTGFQRVEGLNILNLCTQ
jgi:predicted nucleic acid-binding protein